MISSGGAWAYIAAIPIAMLFGSVENGVIREMLTLEKNNRVRQEETIKKIMENGDNKNV